MSDLPRYPDTTGKDMTQRVNELENYVINLQRYIRFALENIDDKSLTQKFKQEFVGKVSFTDLATDGSTEINGGNITTGSINADLIDTGTLNAIDINGVNITGSNINGGSINGSTLSSFEDGTEYSLIIDQARARWSNKIDGTSYAEIKYFPSSGSLSIWSDHLYFSTPGTMTLNARRLEAKNTCWATAINNVAQTFPAGQITTVDWNGFMHEIDPLENISFGNNGYGSNGIICNEGGAVEISSVINMRSINASGPDTTGHLILYINGLETAYYYRNNQPGTANYDYCVHFPPLIIPVNAGDKLNLRYFTTAGATSSPNQQNRTTVRYIS